MTGGHECVSQRGLTVGSDPWALLHSGRHTSGRRGSFAGYLFWKASLMAKCWLYSPSLHWESYLFWKTPSHRIPYNVPVSCWKNFVGTSKNSLGWNSALSISISWVMWHIQSEIGDLCGRTSANTFHIKRAVLYLVSTYSTFSGATPCSNMRQPMEG